jgi:hypothetical protein
VIRVHGFTGPQAHKMPVVGFAINDRDQMGEGVFSTSNHSRLRWIGRLRSHPPTGVAAQDRARRHWCDLTKARLGQRSGGLNLAGILPIGAAHDGELI